eukprot:scaffold2682_cov344-Pavlova_lutheri.AAC.21
MESERWLGTPSEQAKVGLATVYMKASAQVETNSWCCGMLRWMAHMSVWDSTKARVAKRNGRELVQLV